MSEPKEVCVDASLAVKWVVKESYKAYHPLPFSCIDGKNRSNL